MITAVKQAGELQHQLAAVAGQDLVELDVGPAPHEVLVLLLALRRDEALEQRSVSGVLGRPRRAAPSEATTFTPLRGLPSRSRYPD